MFTDILAEPTARWLYAASNASTLGSGALAFTSSVYVPIRGLTNNKEAADAAKVAAPRKWRRRRQGSRRLQAGGVAFPVADVTGGAARQHLHLGRGDLAHDLARRAHHQAVVGNHLALGDQRLGAN